MEVNLKTGKTEGNGDGTGGKLEELGIHRFTDQEYFDRIGETQDYFSDFFLSDKLLESLKLSPTKKELLILVKQTYKHLSRHTPSGKSIEREGFREGKNAAYSLLNRCVRLITTKNIPDGVAFRQCTNLCSVVHKMIDDTFDSENSSVNKAYVIHGLPMNMGGMGGAGMDPALKAALTKAFENQQEKTE